ncbi:amidase [Paraconexibacter antarcticus]|uniref:Amidase n=1 Tax=Paraconexibacter antarcticus TaxID=2949664 RepID=A0ABY5DWI5_9ACTN|nr:amidase [Paraconexibacter antarcticus]UTI66026.1 amidase [Paraconexibacter antarcticus]
MDPTEIAFAGAAEQGRMLAAGAITAPQLLDLHLERIARLDHQLGAFRVVLDGEARAEAAAAQARLDAGERAPLLGVPVAIKDDADVAGQTTAWGTSAHGPAKTADAEVVRRLRAAGAVVVGKTNVPEMTIWPFTESLTFGATRNPWDLSRTPGGSSGGTAAAVAAGLVPLGLGSDGGGSIRIPATWCGLFGLKPQRDRVPLAPHDGAWQGLSVNGPLARTVEDAALFLDATADDLPEGGFAAAVRQAPGRLRIAMSAKLPPGVLGRVGRAQRAAFGEAAALLRELGHDVVQRDPDYPLDGAAAQFMPRYLRGIRDDVATMPHPELLEARTRAMARLGGLVSDRRIGAVRAAEAAFTARVTSIFDDVDVLLTPGAATGPPRVGAYQRRGAVGTFNRIAGRVPFQPIWNATGQPAAVVPWGLDGDGLPLSVQLVGRPHGEATLLGLGAQVEAARPWAARRPEYGR